jgi:Tol biopolymer transport system component
LLLSNVTVFSQPKTLGAPEKLIATPNDCFMQAKWSPDGTKIAFSGARYNSIWLSDSNGTILKKVTDDSNAGYGFSWSADGQTLLARPARLDNHHRYNYIKLYGVETAEVMVLQEETTALKQLPVWVEGDSKVAMVVGTEVKMIASGKPVLKSVSGNFKEAILFNGTLVAGNAKADVSFSQFKDRIIFNQRTSPSGEKVVFQVNGLGLFVANSDGTQLKNIGQGEQASWMPDEKYVVVTLVEDDGEVITKGNLYAVDVETGHYSPLMESSQWIALNPSVSPDGAKLLFDNPKDGALYLLNLSK